MLFITKRGNVLGKSFKAGVSNSHLCKERILKKRVCGPHGKKICLTKTKKYYYLGIVKKGFTWCGNRTACLRPLFFSIICCIFFCLLKVVLMEWQKKAFFLGIKINSCFLNLRRKIVSKKENYVSCKQRSQSYLILHLTSG